MKTAVSIPDSDFKAAEKLAKRLGMKRSKLYQVAIADFLARHIDSNITGKLDEIYADADRAVSLPQDVQRMQAESISEERW